MAWGATKVCLVKGVVFPVVVYECESWTIKKAECQRIDAFELWCWRRLFDSPLDCKEILPVHPKVNQSWIFIGKTDVEAETPILWPPDVKNWLIWKDPDDWKDPERLKAGEEGGDGGWDGWMASLTQWTWVWVNSRSWCWTARPGMLQPVGSQSQTQLSDWTELKKLSAIEIKYKYKKYCHLAIYIYIKSLYLLSHYVGCHKFIQSSMSIISQ